MADRERTRRSSLRALRHGDFAVNFAQFIGVVVLTPWAGHAADRFGRRKLIIATQLGATLVSAVLA